METKDQERAEFLANRRKGIGGSDAHHLLNIHPKYSCQRMLWNDKTGVEPDEDFLVTGAIRRGNRLEDIAAEYYAASTGREVRKVGHCQHPEHPWMVVHIDREIYAEDKPGRGVLEIKVPGWQVWKELKEEGVSLMYVAQVQWGMMVTQSEWGSFAVYEPTTDALISFDYKPNKELQSMLFEAGERLWKQVQAGDPPERLSVLSPACAECRWRRPCWGEALKDIPVSPDAILRDDKLLRSWIEAYAQYDAVEKLAKDEKQTCKEAIASILGDVTKVKVMPRDGMAGASITFSPRRTWNKRKLAKEHPDVIQKYSTKLDETALSDARPDLRAEYADTDGNRTLRIDLELYEK